MVRKNIQYRFGTAWAALLLMAHKLTSIRNIFLTHLCRMESSTLTLWTGPFPTERVSGYFLLLPCLIEISISNTV